MEAARFLRVRFEVRLAVLRAFTWAVYRLAIHALVQFLVTQTWTPEAVLALAPDPASAKAGQGLAAARQWETLGRDEHALWGEIKGSGANPYQTRIDLREPAFKCSCPSRKFPCKHGIGLLLAFTKEAAAFKRADPPAWVSDWLGGREQRAEKKAEKSATATVPDAEAQRGRAEQRESRVTDGLDQLLVWLADFVRAGFIQAQGQSPSYWNDMAARLVDAQAPGLARWVRTLESVAHAGPGWEDRLLHATASIDLVRRAYLHRENLSTDLVEEVRAAVGWTTREDDVLAKGEGVLDHWFVLGAVVENEDRMRVRRTWLHGRSTGRPALLLDFAIGAQPLAAGHLPGIELEAELTFYPGSLGLRAAIKSIKAARTCGESLPGTGIEAALESYAGALARVPWVERWPMTLGEVVPEMRGGMNAPGWHLSDAQGHSLAITPRFAFGWHLLAVSGGHPVQVFGEWDGAMLRPLAVSNGASLIAFGESAIATREAA
jgi:SWIM zinc finger